ncbi:DUF3995 domain-containing protein [Alicyclobacillus fodiniaquatilis]|uniref:DUF3995 domain-containing protein n=1 Tax=Alicyclobacillus fodiniaquatilis TaxID=1661150 RepID=A0ABW4JF55_9BACL
MLDLKFKDEHSPILNNRQWNSKWLLRSGYAVCLWSIAYMIPHVYWALGGTAGLSLLKPSVSVSTSFKLINWVALPFFIVPTLAGLGFIYFHKSKIIRSLLLFVSVLGCSIATSHGIYGIVYRGLQITNVIGLGNGTFHIHEDAYVLWDMVIFEPWFLLEGILLATVGWFFLGEARTRKIWLTTCILGIIVGLTTGIMGVRFA